MLKTLEQANLDAFVRHASANKPRPSGIACPRCGAELFDNNDGVVLTSNPPQIGVHCACGHKGTRIQ